MNQKNQLVPQRNTFVLLQNAISKKRNEFSNIFAKYKVPPTEENIKKIERLPLYGKRELVKDLFCLLFKNHDTKHILKNHKGLLGFIEKATIESYMPDLLLLANLLPPEISPVDPPFKWKGHIDQLGTLRHCIGETTVPKIDAPFPEKFHVKVSPYREPFLQGIFGNQHSIS